MTKTRSIKFVLLKSVLTFYFILSIIGLSNVAYSQTIKVDHIVIEGNRRIPEARILPYLVKPDKPFTLEEIDESVKKLYQTGLFFNIKTDLYVDGDKFFLKYILEEMPLVGVIVFEGNKEVKSSSLEEKVLLRQGQVLSLGQVEKALEAIRALYEEEKRFGTKIQFKLVPRSLNSVDVHFIIDESDIAQVYNIYLFGNEHITRDEILSAMPTKERGFWSIISGSGKLSKDMLLADRELVRLLYLEKGYAKVMVGDPEINFSLEHPEMVNIVIRIEEGEQFFVRSVSVSDTGDVSKEEVEKAIKLKEGAIFNIKQYQADITDITALYTTKGYAYANVEPIINLDEETREVDVSYKIDEGNLVYIGRININGNKGTNDNVIRRQIDQMEGELYNSSLIQEARANTMATGYFESVQIQEKSVGKDQIDLDVEVVEQSTGSFTVGAAYSTVDGLMGMLQLSRSNFLGWGHNVSLRAEISFVRFDFSVSYTDPWFFDWPVSVGVDLFNLERSWYEYTRRALGGSLRAGHALIKRKLYMNYRFGLYTVDIFNIDSNASQYIKDQAGKTETHVFSPSISWNNINNPSDPTSGNKSQLFVDFAGLFLGGNANFLKVGIDTTQYFPLVSDGNLTLMLHAEGGYLFAIKSGYPIPVDERYRIGGINSLRGYDYGSVGPRDSNGYSYGGDKYYQGNVELIFPIKKDIRLKGLLFFDCGNALAEGQSFFEAPLLMTAGVGIRWQTPMGPFRLEWGYKLNKQPTDTSADYKFEFSIGGTF